METFTIGAMSSMVYDTDLKSVAKLVRRSAGSVHSSLASDHRWKNSSPCGGILVNKAADDYKRQYVPKHVSNTYNLRFDKPCSCCHPLHDANPHGLTKSF